MKTKELKKALEMVKPGLANQDMIEQTTSFAFTNDKVITYNDEISISYPLKSEIEGVVEASQLSAFLGKIKNEEIEIETSEKELIIKVGKAKAGFVLTKEIKLPFAEIGKVQKWKEIPKDFVQILKKVVGTCSADMLQPSINCVHINQSGFIEATNNFTILRYKVLDIKFATILIPASSVQAVIRFNPEKISVGEGWVHFINSDKAVLSCRIMEEVFPDTSKFLEIEGTELKLPSQLKESIDKAEIFAKSDLSESELVKITLKENSLLLEASGELSWYKDKIRVRYNAQPFTFETNAPTLKRILEEESKCILNENLLKFEKDNWAYVTSLIAEN